MTTAFHRGTLSFTCNPFFIVAYTDTLIFDAIQKSDSGEYTCTASNVIQNQVKQSQSSTVVDVICKLIFQVYGSTYCYLTGSENKVVSFYKWYGSDKKVCHKI